MAAAYIRRKGNNLYYYSVHKTRTTSINGSRLSLRPDRSNDDVFVLVPRVIWRSGSSEQKSETIGFGKENRHILHCLFRFKLTLRSRLVLGCYETWEETSTRSSSAI